MCTKLLNAWCNPHESVMEIKDLWEVLYLLFWAKQWQAGDVITMRKGAKANSRDGGFPITLIPQGWNFVGRGPRWAKSKYTMAMFTLDFKNEFKLPPTTTKQTVMGLVIASEESRRAISVTSSGPKNTYFVTQRMQEGITFPETRFILERFCITYPYLIRDMHFEIGNVK